MKTKISLLAATAFAVFGSTPANAQENDTSVIIRPHGGELKTLQSVSVFFPDAMVAPDVVGESKESGPFTITPAVEGLFNWRSQTECAFIVNGPVRPGTKYTLALRNGLLTLANKRIPASSASAEFGTTPLTTRALLQPLSISNRIQRNVRNRRV